MLHRAPKIRRPGQALPQRAGVPRLNLAHPAASYVDELFLFSFWQGIGNAGVVKGSRVGQSGAANPFSNIATVGPVADFTTNNDNTFYYLASNYSPPIGVPFTVIGLFNRVVPPGTGATKVMPLWTTVTAVSTSKSGIECDVGNGYDSGSAIYGPHATSWSSGNNASAALQVNGVPGATPFVSNTWNTVAASYQAVPSHDQSLWFGSYTNNQFAFCGQLAAIVILANVPANSPLIPLVSDDLFALLRPAQAMRMRSIAAAPPPPAARGYSLFFGATA